MGTRCRTSSELCYCRSSIIYNFSIQRQRSEKSSPGQRQVLQRPGGGLRREAAARGTARWCRQQQRSPTNRKDSWGRRRRRRGPLHRLRNRDQVVRLVHEPQGEQKGPEGGPDERR
jgi:hypothetical protein